MDDNWGYPHHLGNLRMMTFFFYVSLPEANSQIPWKSPDFWWTQGSAALPLPETARGSLSGAPSARSHGSDVKIFQSVLNMLVELIYFCPFFAKHVQLIQVYIYIYIYKYVMYIYNMFIYIIIYIYTHIYIIHILYIHAYIYDYIYIWLYI